MFKKVINRIYRVFNFGVVTNLLCRLIFREVPVNSKNVFSTVSSHEKGVC